MKAQGILVFLECVLLYFIIIAISQIQFKKTFLAKLFMLTHFNDNS